MCCMGAYTLFIDWYTDIVRVVFNCVYFLEKGALNKHANLVLYALGHLRKIINFSSYSAWIIFKLIDKTL